MADVLSDPPCIDSAPTEHSEPQAEQAHGRQRAMAQVRPINIADAVGGIAGSNPMAAAIADRAPATDAACGTSTRGLWAGPVTYRPGGRPRPAPAVPGGGPGGKPGAVRVPARRGAGAARAKSSPAADQAPSAQRAGDPRRAPAGGRGRARGPPNRPRAARAWDSRRGAARPAVEPTACGGQGVARPAIELPSRGVECNRISYPRQRRRNLSSCPRPLRRKWGTSGYLFLRMTHTPSRS